MYTAKFIYTKSALKFKKDLFFELDVFDTPAKCLDRINACNDSMQTNKIHEFLPCILKYVKILDEELYHLKKCLRDEHADCISRMKGAIIQAIDYSLEDFLRDATFCLATSGDDGKTKILANNIFARDIENNRIPKRKYITIPKFSPEEPVKLGVYLHDTGTIVLWIDRIFNEGGFHPEILFQKVLLHEIIHGLLDISPRYIHKEKGKYEIRRFDSSYNSGLEECYDNTLVLYVYHHTNGDRFFPYVYEFINNQPHPYCDAIAKFDKNTVVPFKQDLTAHLVSKLRPANVPSRTPKYQYYTLDNDDYTEDDIWDEAQNKIICAESWLRGILNIKKIAGYPLTFEPGFHNVIVTCPHDVKIRFTYCIKTGDPEPFIQFTVQDHEKIYQYDYREDHCILLQTAPNAKSPVSPLGLAEFVCNIIRAVNPDTNLCEKDLMFGQEEED